MHRGASWRQAIRLRVMSGVRSLSESASPLQAQVRVVVRSTIGVCRPILAGWSSSFGHRAVAALNARLGVQRSDAGEAARCRLEPGLNWVQQKRDRSERSLPHGSGLEVVLPSRDVVPSFYGWWQSWAAPCGQGRDGGIRRGEDKGHG